MGARILGWDVGGANIKAVRIVCSEEQTSTPVVVERPFPLWREPDRLPTVLAEVAERLDGADLMAVTMTAELADCFATKQEGVSHVLGAFRAAFSGAEPWVYGIDGQFRALDKAGAEPLLVAAANWMASATLAARFFPDAIFLDVGSTTTDVIPVLGGSVAARGRTDVERLMTGELVYTGALRTPVCAIVGSVPLREGSCAVAAEMFAVAADVHLWLGRLDGSDYTCETPDGKGRSRAEAGARIARMVCADLEMMSLDEVTAIAEHIASAQQRQIVGGIRQVLGRLGPAKPTTAVLAGGGAFLARTAAREVGLSVREMTDYLGSGAGACAAAAVAYLLAESGVVDT